VLVPKIGWVQFKRSRALAGWTSYRSTADRAGRWHIAFAVIPEPIPAPGTGVVVGVVRGVAVAVALSTGELTSPAGRSVKEAERLLRLQRRLARAARGSNRRRKVKTLIAGLKATGGDRRKDWVEKAQHRPGPQVRRVRGRVPQRQSHDPLRAGTVQKPGRNVTQKTGLNWGILTFGWGLLAARWEQKAPGRVEKVTAAYTSATGNPARTSLRAVARAKRGSCALLAGTGRTPS
jgi:transposase